ncbi:hypothetical protein CYMTET_50255 [Cymbomonas tetramitiformis]|uniref:Uncharacterized protein n=1 Tax=Cymbomonas tetramitiformis TaxID=36881 RepID=A0AAE0BQF1_9CHLO|nr:hypothetical protein CYMTET_50255 [Cymbomonas tetramitiformis]
MGGKKRHTSSLDQSSPSTEGNFTRNFVIVEQDVCGTVFSLLTRDMMDMTRYSVSQSATSSCENMVSLDEEGRPTIPLDMFNPLTWANETRTAEISFQDLRVRVLAGAGQGGRIWPSTPLICQYLQTTFAEASDDATRDCRVLELGGGIGLGGLYAAALSQRLQVTVSDNVPLMLQLAKANVALNRSKFHNDVEVKHLDWDALSGESDDVYEVIIGSDIVYEGVNVENLWNAISALLVGTPGARFVMSHQRRCEDGQEDPWLVHFCNQAGTARFSKTCEFSFEGDLFLYAWERM